MTAMHHPHHRRRLLPLAGALVVAGALLVASCGVPRSSSFEAFDDENELGFGQTTSTSTTSTTVPSPTSTVGATTTTIDTESVTLYFLVGTHLSSVSIALARPATPLQVVSALAAGPPAGPVGPGLRSALPFRAELGVESTRGGVIVSVPEGFFGSIQPADQRLAVAQIVLTLTERGGVGTVQFQQGSMPIVVPKGSGVSTAPGEAVYRDDYLNLLTPDQVSPATTASAATAPAAATTTVTGAPRG
jgi:hypothetical protein